MSEIGVDDDGNNNRDKSGVNKVNCLVFSLYLHCFQLFFTSFLRVYHSLINLFKVLISNEKGSCSSVAPHGYSTIFFIRPINDRKVMKSKYYILDVKPRPVRYYPLQRPFLLALLSSHRNGIVLLGTHTYIYTYI